MLRVILSLLLLQSATPPTDVEVPPEIRQVVEAFFATQEAEDAAAYLALWSAKAQRPQPQQLQFIFESGDDKFSDVRITHAAVTDTTARIRVSVLRHRTDAKMKRPDGTPRLFTTPFVQALTFAREADGWKIVREGSPVDELAAALVAENDIAARTALMKAEPDLLSSRLVDGIARRADGFAQMSRFAEAKGLYERSLEVARAIGDRKAEGQALGNLANTHYYLREFDRSRALYEARLALDRETGHEEGAASALVGIATVHYTTADYGMALKLYREALEIQERIDDQVMIPNTLISTGNVLFLQGDFEAAIADYRRAEAMKRKQYDVAGAWMALEGLGRVYAAQGDLGAALTAFTTVRDERVSHKVGGARQAITLQYIGEIHFKLGNTEAARSAFEEGRVLFEAANDLSSVGRIHQSIAVNELVAARPAAGEKAYAASITACTSAKDDDCVARAQVGLGYALAAQKKYVEAIAWYRKSIAGFRALKLPEPAARAQVGLAEALSGKGDHADALTVAVEARHAAVALDVDDLLWRALTASARAQRKLGRVDEALGTAKAAVVTVRRMADAALKRPGTSIPRDAASAFATTAVLHAEAGDPAAAFAVSEEMRSHTLRAWLAVNERDISPGMSDEERESERALAVELTTLHARREREKGLPKPDTARVSELERAIADGETKRAALLESLFTRLPDLRTWRGLSPSVDASALDALIPDPATGVLAFVVDERDLLVLVASRPHKDGAVAISTHIVAIERGDLAERIADALSAGALTNLAEWRKRSPALFSLLPAPLVAQVAALQNVYILPDETLWRVPFEAMPVASGYLGDTVRVKYIPSVTAVSMPMATGAASGPPLVIAGPTLSAATIDRLKVTAPSWTIQSPPPAAVAKPQEQGEADRQPFVTLEGAAASALAVRAAIGSAAFIHIRAPFRVNAASPLFSPVLLAPPLDNGPDAHLEARQIFNLATQATLVTFEDPAALSMRDAAAALTSIYWAWRAAGVRTIGLRRWGGVEAATLDTLGRLHDRLRAGDPPADALLKARPGATGGKPAPGLWAAWMLIGDR